tara:strand:+ start:457 stop:633 length:177 start_codon:yes stop_codon:yes gene_type:complete
MATEEQLDKLTEEILNPTSPLFNIMMKRGLDEVFGSNYDPYKKSTDQIKKDILNLEKE